MTRILLVEDSRTQVAAYSLLLQDAGYDVLEAVSAEQALQLLDQHAVELVLTDLTLPGITGLELCRRITADPRTRKIPVVVLTGSGDVANVLRSLEAGARAYASKDRGDEQLLAVIAKTLAMSDEAELPVREAVTFRGETYDLNVTPARLLAVMLSAFEDLSSLNDRHEELNQQLASELQQRASVEKALRDSEAIYHSLVENVPVSLFRKDLEGRFTFGNQPFCLSLNVASEELVGKSDFDFFPRELAEKYRRNDLQVMQTGEVFEDVEEHATPDGRKLYVQVLKAPVCDSEGKLAGVQVVFWDVTDREVTRRQLADSEARKQAIFESSLDCMIISDQHGNIIEFNRAAERTLGFRREEILGQPLDQLFALSERTRENLDRYSEYREEGSMLGRRQESPLRRKDGSMFMAEIAMQPIQLGDAVQFATVLHDITQRKQWEEELQRARDSAESANRAKSDFLANMSHEIRTPMNAVIGMTELVLGTELGAEQREHLEIVQDSADSLLDLINDILDFSKIESGKLELDPQPFAVRDRVGDTMKSLAVRAHEKGLELACHISPDVPDAVVGDSGRLRQVIVNLVGNAIKFTERGEVLLDVGLQTLRSDEAVLQLSVLDTGIGIPEHQQRSVFEAFQQADTSTTRRFGGTGLGLAISSRLVQLMGGAIELESQPGIGSTFRFTARFQTADPAHVPQAVREPRSVDGVTVLVVDDNATNRRILDEMLTGWEMRPTVVADAEAALKELQQRKYSGTPFQLLVTDVSMPGVDGFWLVERILESDDYSEMAIVMLTSADRQGDIERCRQMGIARYMTKPVKQAELLTVIETIAGVAPTDSQPRNDRLPEVEIEPLRVLLAEDSLTNQKLALALLGAQGHSIVVANDGREAVERAAAESFDVILMDVQMPELDGFEATALIREGERSTGKRTPIIAMTAHAMKGDRERCLVAGMDDYVSKPIRTAELFTALMRVRDAQEAAADVPASDTGASNMRSDDSQIAVAAETEADRCMIGTLINWEAALDSLGGDQSILAIVVDAVLEECPQLIDQLAAAISEQNAAVIHRIAHTIKGSVRTFEAQAVSDLAWDIEQCGSEGRLEGIESLFDRLRVLLNRLLDELHDFRSRDDEHEHDDDRPESVSIFDD